MINYNHSASSYIKNKQGRWERAPISDEIKASYIAQVEALSNEELLQDYTDLAGGDDYDGCHTVHGQLVYELLGEELRNRLTKIGFLND